MKTLNNIKCCNCGIINFHHLFFLHERFHYLCPSCETVHILSENMLYDENDYFRYSKNFHGNYSCYYLGSINKDFNVVDERFEYRNDWEKKVFKIYYNFYKHYINFNKDLNTNFLKIDEIRPYQGGNIYICNALQQHFQESLRATYRLYGHVKNNERTYNIILSYSDFSYHYLPIEDKFDNKIDMIISVDRSRYIPVGQDHYQVNNLSTTLSKKINYIFEKIEGNSTVIGKRPGPFHNICGSDILENLLNPDHFVNKIDQLDNKKYFTILAKTPSNRRCGINQQNQLDALFQILSPYKLDLCIISFGNELSEELAKSYDVPFLKNLSQPEQWCFYKYYCRAVIGCAGSGMNNPSLFRIPSISFALDRSFLLEPCICDFYCYGKLLSPYNELAVNEKNPNIKETWKCNTFKPDFIKEVIVDKAVFDPFLYRNDLKNFVETVNTNDYGNGNL
jgi:hypothetical protein